MFGMIRQTNKPEEERDRLCKIFKISKMESRITSSNQLPILRPTRISLHDPRRRSSISDKTRNPKQAQLAGDYSRMTTTESMTMIKTRDQPRTNTEIITQTSNATS